MERIGLKTNRRIDLIDITDKVQAVVAKAKSKTASVLSSVRILPRALTINENADHR